MECAIVKGNFGVIDLYGHLVYLIELAAPLPEAQTFLLARLE